MVWVDRRQDGRLVAMLDLIFVVVTVTFFALSTAYVCGCERLRKP
jgi:hypothetical protein